MFEISELKSDQVGAKRPRPPEELSTVNSISMPDTLSPTNPLTARSVKVESPAMKSPRLRALAKRSRLSSPTKRITLVDALASINKTFIRQYLAQNPSNHENLFNLATQHENITFLSVMLEDGFDVNTQNNKGWAALHFAAYYDKPDTFAFLLKQGAALYVQNDDNRYPLDVAKKHESNKILNFEKLGLISKFLKYEFIPDPLCTAVKNGEITKAKHIILNSVGDVDTFDCNNYRTPLSFAVENGDLEFVRLLLDSGADVTDKFSVIKGENVLFYAAENNQKEIFDVLLAKVLDKTHQDLRFDLLEKCSLKDFDKHFIDALWKTIPKRHLHSIYRYRIIDPAIEQSKLALVKDLIHNRGYDVNFNDCLSYAAEIYFEKPTAEKHDVLQFLLNHPGTWLTTPAILSQLAEHNDKTILRHYLTLLMSQGKEVWLAKQDHTLFKAELSNEEYSRCVQKLKEAEICTIEDFDSDSDSEEIVWNYDYSPQRRKPLQQVQSPRTFAEEMEIISRILCSRSQKPSQPKNDIFSLFHERER